MHIFINTCWETKNGTDKNIDRDLFRVLKLIRDQGSIKMSAQLTGLSYRHVWGLIRHWEDIFNHALVKTERGRGKGASLTELGHRLVWAQQYLQEEIHADLNKITQEINQSLSELIEPPVQKTIKLFASHGMAITYLYELLKSHDGFMIDFETHGSLDSLQNLSNGHCQMAGFHLPLQLVNKIIAPQYKQWLSPKNHCLLNVAIREQGLIVKADNPKKIENLTDLLKRSVRFINRQKNSGTRTIFDQLLIEQNIDPGRINGYTNEEFTHVAVAAMIASGAADAGFGIAAAAEKFELGFIPFLQEAYVLAIDKALDSSIKTIIRQTLESRKFRMKINKLAGYNANHSGKELAFPHLLSDNRS